MGYSDPHAISVLSGRQPATFYSCGHGRSSDDVIVDRYMKAGNVGDLIIRSNNSHEKYPSRETPSRVPRRNAVLARLNGMLEPPVQAAINPANNNDEIVVKASMLRAWLNSSQARSWFA